jgi:hypothetical protein
MSRASKRIGTNVTKALLVEIQTTIALACYDSPEIVQGGDSMTEMEQAKIIIDNFGGNDDPDSISYLDQFVNGLGRFAGLFTSSEPDESGQIFLTMPQKLHRQKGLHIFVGPTSITKDLLLQRNFTNTTKITGRTLHKRALQAVQTCKKMMALVTAPGCPYRDGDFPSGTNWDDYILWCLDAIQVEFEREEKARQPRGMQTAMSGPIVMTMNEPARITITTTTDDTPSVAATLPEITAATSAARQQGDKRGTEKNPYFKFGVGFLAWALWGHIPIQDGAAMASMLFNESKVDSSFGRGTHTRTAMRKAAMAASMPPVDNRRGKKREIDVMQSPENSVELDLWKNTLKHLEAEALEKQEKQHHSMRLRIIRDKLAARRGKREVILQQLTLSSKFRKKPDEILLEKMQSNEDEIEKLELELEKQQQSECDRQIRVLEEKRSTVKLSIEMATPMIGTSGSFGSSGIESSTSDDNENGSGRGGNDRITLNTKNDDADGNESTPRANTPKNITTTCTECNLMPSNHTCLKCKRVRVCSVCCDANRGLQNNPWCKTCFENETPASQTKIRNGDYNYR